MDGVSRGIRNNNPLNIRKSSVAWQGKLVESSDPSFEKFTSIEWGIRAGIVNIRTYIKKYHCDTIQAIITKWAPASDGNDTKAYIDTVCKKTQLPANKRLKATDKNLICMLVWAMIQVECGQEVGMGKIENAYALI